MGLCGERKRCFEIIMLLEDSFQFAELLSGPIFYSVGLYAARWLGLLFGFSPFAWGLARNMILRMGLAIALGIPNAFAFQTVFLDAYSSSSTLIRVLLLPKEFLLGYAFGFLCALPFLSITAAGSIIDQYRGEQSSGIVDPSGGNISTTGLMLMITAGYYFFSTDGLYKMFGVLSLTYGVWAPHEFLPYISLDASYILVRIIVDTLLLIVWVAAPVLSLLVLIDLAVAISSRLGGRFQLDSFSFTLKNLAYVSIIGLYSLSFLYFIEAGMFDPSKVLQALKALFNE